MGWSGGSSLAEDVYLLVRKHIPLNKRQQIAEKIYDLFCDLDADDWDGSSTIEKDGDINQELEIDE